MVARGACRVRERGDGGGFRAFDRRGGRSLAASLVEGSLVTALVAGCGGGGATGGGDGGGGGSGTGGGNAGYGKPAPAALWSRAFGDGQSQLASSVVLDSHGDIVVAGELGDDTASVDFGGGPVTGARVFLVKLDAEGNHLASRGLGDGGYLAPPDLAAGPDGGLFFAAHFAGTLDLGGGAMLATQEASLVFAELDATGGHVASRQLEGSGSVSVAAHPGGGVALVMNVGEGNVRVDRLDASGALVWRRDFVDPKLYGSGTFVAVAVDGAGNVVVAGSSEGSFDFGGGVLESGGVSSTFVVKLDAKGDHVFSRRFGAAARATRSVAVGPGGEIVVAGKTVIDVDFGGGSVPGDSNFAVVLSPDGAHVSSAALGGSPRSIAPAAALDAAGGVVLAGSCEGNHPSCGEAPALGDDLVIARFRPDGALDTRARYGRDGDDADLVVDAEGHAIVVGAFTSRVDFGNGAFLADGHADAFVVKLPAP